MSQIRTVYGLMEAYKAKHPNGHFFDSDTLKFFGETLSSMSVLKAMAVVTDYAGEQHTCYILSSLQRKFPGGPRRAYHYFDAETLEDIIPGMGTV